MSLAGATAAAPVTPPFPAPGVPSPGVAPASVVPPASVPITFLAASGVGLFLLGIAIALSVDHAAAPTAPGMVSAAHSAMLGFLTMGVLGAVHQFGPVVAQRPLRSVRAARVTAALLIPGVWTLAGGFAHGPSWLVPAGGATAATAIALAAWNLSGPLSARGKGVPVAGLRLSIAWLCATAAFGVVYAVDRNVGWFPLLPHRVLAHAHLGLLGWLGLTYVAVAEKLWPMFLLSHRPGRGPGGWAVGLLGSGAPLLAVGLLFGWPVLALPAGLAVVAGLGCHLASLAGVIRHRRRRLELLHGFVLGGAGFLVVAAILGALAALAPVSSLTRMHLVAGEVAALAAWLGLALVGHAHKVVPFIAWTWLRGQGVTTTSAGRPLLFGDLYSSRLARLTLVAVSGGWALVVAGLVGAAGTPLLVGGVLLSIAGLLVTTNLARGTLTHLSRRTR